MEINQLDTTMLVAIVSATSAIVGVVISQIFVLFKEYLNKKHLKQILLREKYEELSMCVQNAIVNSNQAEDSRSISELTKFALNEPLRKSVSLSLIYFPEFKEAIIDLNNTYIDHYNVLVENYKRGINETVGTQAAAHNYQDYIDTTKQFQMARQQVDNLIEKYARKYAKA